MGDDYTAMTGEFDDFGHPPTVAKIELRHVDFVDSLVLVQGDKEYNILEACRDQWGVFYYIQDTCICQEDTTRSFLDALIKGLQQMKERNEMTIEATVVVNDE